MKAPMAKLVYVALLASAVLAGSMFRVFGSSTPTVFNACLTGGGTLVQVSTQGATSCPAGTTAVSWNQQGQPGAAGGLTAAQDVTASGTFVVPAGVSHLSVEAWGGGGGGGSVSGCFAGGGGGSGGYARAIIAVTPGESLGIVIGSGGAANAAGTTTHLDRGTTALVSATGGAGAADLGVGGAGGTATGGAIVRVGHAGTDGQEDPMCQFGFGPFFGAPAGVPGSSVQGSVETIGSRSAGGSGAGLASDPTGRPGGAGEVILSW